MPKLIDHTETDYDFCLTFIDSPAPDINDEIKTGVIDDKGQVVHFVGTAYVVAKTVDFSRRNKTTVYASLYPFIDQPETKP